MNTAYIYLKWWHRFIRRRTWIAWTGTGNQYSIYYSTKANRLQAEDRPE